MEGIEIPDSSMRAVANRLYVVRDIPRATKIIFSYRKHYIDVERKEEGFDLSPARIFPGQFRVKSAGVK